MGLSERKTKQRLGADPRNLVWANDNSRFGQQYLEKFGWSAGSGSGLGASGQGRLSNISVAQKLNLLGIGGNNSNGDVSWRQNRDYELMLKRLNTSGGDEEEPITVSMVPGGFVRAVEDKETSEQVEENLSVVEEVGEKERTRLRKEDRRREKAAAKAKANIAHGGVSSVVEPPSAPVGAAFTVSSCPPAASTKPPRRMAHRAKFRASKQLAAANAAALAEILGISPSAVPSGAPSRAHSALDTPADSPSPAADAADQVRTSTTSVGDYFAAKMKMRACQLVTAPAASTSTSTSVPTSTPTTTQPATEPTVPVPVVPELGPDDDDAQDESAGRTLVDGVVEGKKKDKNKKRKRKDVVEKAEAPGDGAEPHGESKKKKKKRRNAE